MGGGGVVEGASRYEAGYQGRLQFRGKVVTVYGIHCRSLSNSEWVIGVCIVGKSSSDSLQSQEIDEMIKGATAKIGSCISWRLFHVYFLHVHDRKVATVTLTACTCNLGHQRQLPAIPYS